MTIINRQKEFIYLKSHKTAGTSTEFYLITQTVLGSDIYRTSEDIARYGFPRKCKDREFAMLRRAYSVARSDGFRALQAAKRRLGADLRIREHMGGEEVRRLVGSEFFDRARVVTNVRNPWDALVSSYKWRQTRRAGAAESYNVSFSEFLSRSLEVGDKGVSEAEEYLFYPYLAGGERAVETVIPFEDLGASIDQLVANLGLTGKGFEAAGVHEKKVRQGDDYRGWYSDAQARLLESSFSNFLERFNYDFDRPNEPPVFQPSSLIVRT
jgi:hypothetical protein